MTKEEILKADILDIVFENRNKNYGAYDLRKYYNNRLAMALGISLIGAVSLFFMIRPDSGKSVSGPFIDDSVVLIEVVQPKTEVPIEEPIEQPPPQERVQELPPSIEYLPIEIVDNDLADDNVPTQNDIAKSVISNVTTNGTGDIDIVPAATSSDGNGKANAPVNSVPEIPDYNSVEEKPEYPGGMEALKRLLSRHLSTPEELEANEIKTVYVKFIVGTDGVVTGFQILRSAGNIYDNEVLRVLKKMPKWKPAKQNGSNVAVTFTQPVTFKGVEE